MIIWKDIIFCLWLYLTDQISLVSHASCSELQFWTDFRQSRKQLFQTIMRMFSVTVMSLASAQKKNYEDSRTFKLPGIYMVGTRPLMMTGLRNMLLHLWYSYFFPPYFFLTNFVHWNRVLAVRGIVRGSSCKSREKSRRKQAAIGGMNHPLEVSLFLHEIQRGSGFQTQAPHLSGMNLDIGVCILLHTRQPLSW